MKMRKLFGTAGLAVAIVAATPATAQFGQSEGYKFLQAVKDAKGQDVTDMLSTPGSTLVDTRNGDGDGALHIVIKRDDPTWLRFLLQKGADPNLRDNGGTTPLLLAVNQNEDDCVQVM